MSAPVSTYTRESFWAELEGLGEPKVRERLITLAYGETGDKRALVIEWLRLKDEARTTASQAAMADTAREASTAAVRAAVAAEAQARTAAKALTTAKIAAAVAIAALIVSIAAPLLGRWPVF